MKTEMELVDNAIAMIQAYKAGKKLTYTDPPHGTPKKFFGAQHLICLIGYGYEITIAPEPKEIWRVIDKNGRSKDFGNKENADRARINYDVTYACFAPHTIEHYMQVMP